MPDVSANSSVIPCWNCGHQKMPTPAKRALYWSAGDTKDRCDLCHDPVDLWYPEGTIPIDDAERVK